MHNAYATYAYSFPIAGTTNLNLGVSVGALSQNFDMSKAVYISGNDPIIKSLLLTPPVTRADLRASAFVNGEKWFAGFAFSRLTKPRFDYVYYNYTAAYQMQSQGSLMLGYNIDLGDDLLLKPALYASAYDFNYFRVQYNVSMWYQDKFWLGVGGNDIGQIGANIWFSHHKTILKCLILTILPQAVSGSHSVILMSSIHLLVLQHWVVVREVVQAMMVRGMPI
jgi:type IX secretion system PorP/SprF family membrane protein